LRQQRRTAKRIAGLRSYVISSAMAVTRPRKPL
jgi:hypothetical protein